MGGNMNKRLNEEMHKWIKFLKTYAMNLTDLYFLFLIYLLLDYGNGGFTTKRFYLFFPFVFEIAFFYFTIRLLLYVIDGFKRIVMRGDHEDDKEGNKE